MPNKNKIIVFKSVTKEQLLELVNTSLLIGQADLSMIKALLKVKLPDGMLDTLFNFVYSREKQFLAEGISHINKIDKEVLERSDKLKEKLKKYEHRLEQFIKLERRALSLSQTDKQ